MPVVPLPRIAVIGQCTAAGCERRARVHVEVVIGDRVVRGPVCERCERATRLGAVLYGDRRPA